MSNHRQSLELAVEDSDDRFFNRDIYQKRRQTSYDPYLTYSSSPPRSSSPPGTPCAPRHQTATAYICSSPDIAADSIIRQQITDPWSRFDLPWNASTSVYSSKSRLLLQSHHVTKGHGFLTGPDSHSLDSEAEGSQTGGIPSDSEEETDDVFGVGNNNGYRTTVFRTSAERGLWRSDPLPMKRTNTPLFQTRKSVPTLSRVPTSVAINARTVSEPAPLSMLQSSEFYLKNETQTMDHGVDDPIVDPSRPESAGALDSRLEDEVSSPHTLPSLMTDIEGSEDDVDIEFALAAPSSPLPPSSPPLSPMTRTISILSRSSSPFSVVHERSSSPLSELTDYYSDEETRDNVEDDHILNDTLGKQTERTRTADTDADSELSSELGSSCCDIPEEVQDFTPSNHHLPTILVDAPSPLSSSPVSTASKKNNAVFSCEDPDATLPSIVESTSGPTSHVHEPYAENLDTIKVGNVSKVAKSSRLASIDPDEGQIDGDFNRSQSQKLDSSSALKDMNGVIHRSSSTAQPSSSRASSVKTMQWEKEQSGSGPMKRKQMTDMEPDDTKTSGAQTKVEGKKRGICDDEEDVENEESSDVGPKQKRRKRMDRDNTGSKPTKRKANSRRQVPVSSTYDDEPLDAEEKQLHATICGMIIETMATSRATSLPISSIFKLVMNSQPSLKSQRPEQDWLCIFERVLVDGEAGRGSGVFGKVESSGKDESDRPLEAHWFYVPERDEDQERAALIRSMMPRPGKRTETMKYKQYYWRPLEKMSRWDPEDAL